MLRRLPAVFLVFLCLASVACSSSQKKNVAVAAADEEGEEDLPISDPLEPYNRKIHAFNDFFLRYALTPVSRGWNFITPRFMRVGIDNFFVWAYTPGRLVNNLLQAKFKGAGKELAFFTINGTVGGFGFYNAAQDIFTLERTNEDTDQTLGKWGVGEGAYIVWPFIGPRTLRGTLGFAGDLYMQPQAVIVPVYVRPETIWAQFAIIAATYTVRAVNNISLDPDEYDNFVKDAVDPYAFIRDIYLQNTRKKVAD